MSDPFSEVHASSIERTGPSGRSLLKPQLQGDGASMLLTEEQKAMCPLTWQAAYTQLHRRIMASPPEEQRLLVFFLHGRYDDEKVGMNDR